MKKFSQLFTLCLLATFVSLSGVHARTLLIIKSSKIPLLTEERNVSGFKGISSSGSYDIKISMGNKESLKLEGDVETISDIETVVENGILKIRNKSKNSWDWRSSREKVTIYVNAKSLNSITLSGSGDISVTGIVKAEKLTNTLSGSGTIMLMADAGEYIGSISGSGKIIVSGKADQANVQLSGSGNFDGNSLKTADAEIAISGSGNATINAETTLNAKVSGSGNIRYSGSAKVSQSKSGSGNIRKI